jgi:hypothetical protein
MRYKRFLWLTTYWNHRGIVIEWKTKTGRLYPVVSWDLESKMSKWFDVHDLHWAVMVVISIALYDLDVWLWGYQKAIGYAIFLILVIQVKKLNRYER